MTSLILYGAVIPPQQINSRLDFKQTVKITLDRIKTKIGKSVHLDYRSHASSGWFNRGDLAISLAAHDLAQKLLPNCRIDYAQWENLQDNQLNQSLLFSGGGYFLIDAEGKLPPRVRNDLDRLTSSGVKYGFLGVGINQVRSATAGINGAIIASTERKVVSKLLNNATFIGVRDQQTLDTLQELSNEKITLIGDPALFIRPAVNAKIPQNADKQIRIGINIPFHGPAANERVRRDLKQYIALFRGLWLATGAELFFMVHFDSEVLIAHLLRDAGLPVKIVNGDVATLQATYAGLDMHVGGMLHSCILACSVGTPCVALAYDVKHAGFFNLMEMPEMCVPATPFDVNHALKICLEAFERRAELRNHVVARRELLRTRAESFLRTHLPTLLQTP